MAVPKDNKERLLKLVGKIKNKQPVARLDFNKMKQVYEAARRTKVKEKE